MSTAGAPLTAAATVVAATLLANVGGVQPPKPAPDAGGATPQKDAVAVSVPKEIAFVDSAFPAVAADRDGTIKASVFVRSSLDHDVCVVPVVALRSVSGGAIGPIELPEDRIPQSSVPSRLSLTIKASDLKRAAFPLDLKRAAFPLNGWLSLKVVEPTSPILAVKPIEIREISGPRTGAEWILLRYSLIFAAAGTLLAGLAATKWGKDGGILLHRMGKPTWTFANSWNSNLTIAGTVVTGLISFSGLPDYGHALSKKTYTIVGLMLTALVGLAPVVYNLFSKTVQAKDDNGASAPQLQGYVCLFLAAAFLTMTGVIAQLGIVDLLLNDVAAAGTLSLETARFWHYLLIMLRIALWVYAVVSMTKTIKMQSVPRDEAEGNQPSRIARAGIQLDAATASNVKPQLPDWSLL